MKRFNRKGFTLIELLAVIVILAIVVGITMVTVLPALNESRRNAFDVSAQTAADFLEKQYQLQLIGQATTVPVNSSMTIMNNPDDFTNAGLKATNYTSGSWKINTTTGRACVKLTANDTGDYKTSSGKIACSSSCTASECTATY